MERKKKRIAILGSTGSIGTQALQVIAEHPDLFEAEVLTANNRVDLLVAQARQFQPNAVVIANESKYPELREALADQPIKVYSGSDALCQVVESQEVDVVLTALVGFAGLLPTIHAIRARKLIALANKETLVVAGELVTQLAQTFPEKEIARIDERFTSKMAFQAMIDGGLKKKQRQDKGMIDQVSATIMLQDYMRTL